MFANKDDIEYARRVLGIANAREEFRRQFSENPGQRQGCVDAVSAIILQFEQAHLDPNPELSLTRLSSEQRNSLASNIIKALFETP